MSFSPSLFLPCVILCGDVNSGYGEIQRTAWVNHRPYGNVSPEAIKKAEARKQWRDRVTSENIQTYAREADVVVLGRIVPGLGIGPQLRVQVAQVVKGKKTYHIPEQYQGLVFLPSFPETVRRTTSAQNADAPLYLLEVVPPDEVVPVLDTTSYYLFFLSERDKRQDRAVPLFQRIATGDGIVIADAAAAAAVHKAIQKTVLVTPPVPGFPDWSGYAPGNNFLWGAFRNGQAAPADYSAVPCPFPHDSGPSYSGWPVGHHTAPTLPTPATPRAYRAPSQANEAVKQRRTIWRHRVSDDIKRYVQEAELVGIGTITGGSGVGPRTLQISEILKGPANPGTVSVYPPLHTFHLLDSGTSCLLFLTGKRMEQNPALYQRITIGDGLLVADEAVVQAAREATGKAR